MSSFAVNNFVTSRRLSRKRFAVTGSRRYLASFRKSESAMHALGFEQDKIWVSGRAEIGTPQNCTHSRFASQHIFNIHATTTSNDFK